jgi:ferredoxin
VAVSSGADALAVETPEETRCKQRNRIDPALRLACRTRVTADLSVTAPYW